MHIRAKLQGFLQERDNKSKQIFKEKMETSDTEMQSHHTGAQLIASYPIEAVLWKFSAHAFPFANVQFVS